MCHMVSTDNSFSFSFILVAVPYSVSCMFSHMYVKNLQPQSQSCYSSCGVKIKELDWVEIRAQLQTAHLAKSAACMLQESQELTFLDNAGYNGNIYKYTSHSTLCLYCMFVQVCVQQPWPSVDLNRVPTPQEFALSACDTGCAGWSHKII